MRKEERSKENPFVIHIRQNCSAHEINKKSKSLIVCGHTQTPLVQSKKIKKNAFIYIQLDIVHFGPLYIFLKQILKQRFPHSYKNVSFSSPIEQYLLTMTLGCYTAQHVKTNVKAISIWTKTLTFYFVLC